MLWFNSGYKLMRQDYGCFAGTVLFFPLVRPMMRCIMTGMDQEYSYVGVTWLETVEIPQFAVHRRSLMVSFVLQRQLSMSRLVGRP